MKRLIFVALIAGIALAGFVLGRASGFGSSQPEAQPTSKSFPLPPPPPESSPYFVDDTLEQMEDGSEVVLESPVEGAQLKGDFTVSGRALADHGRLTVSVRSEDGQHIFGSLIPVVSEDDEKYGRFSLAVQGLDHIGPAELEIGFAAGDGEPETVVRNVTFINPDTVSVNLFFTNSEMDFWQNCERVFPVSRNVSSEGNIYRVAIEALLEGPTDEESNRGYGTSIPERAKLKSVAADANGIVTADFSKYLDQGIGGSCMVGSIRSQIEQTISQFPEVRGVVITVEGNEEEALQP